MQADVQAKTRQAADIARKITSYASLWIAFSLLFGAIVSMIAAVAARNEDEREATSAAS
jgi:predicted metal-binding membrane protein